VETRHNGLSWHRATGNSMEPLIRPGDTLLVECRGSDRARKGDVILYRTQPAGTLVCHRVHRIVVREGRSIYRVRGDNSLHFDAEVRPSDILGTVAAVSRGGKVFVLGMPAAALLAARLRYWARRGKAALKRAGRPRVTP
jgi:signal peptidase I